MSSKMRGNCTRDRSIPRSPCCDSLTMHHIGDQHRCHSFAKPGYADKWCKRLHDQEAWSELVSVAQLCFCHRTNRRNYQDATRRKTAPRPTPKVRGESVQRTSIERLC